MKKVIGLIFILLAVSLAACGGSEPAAPAQTTLQIGAMDNLSFNPSSVTAVTGSKVIVDFKNEGALEHNWVLVDGGADLITVSEADALSGATTGNIAGGGVSKISFTAPTAGDYKYVCTIPGHAAGGMVGDLKITDK